MFCAIRGKKKKRKFKDEMIKGRCVNNVNEYKCVCVVENMAHLFLESERFEYFKQHTSINYLVWPNSNRAENGKTYSLVNSLISTFNRIHRQKSAANQ